MPALRLLSKVQMDDLSYVMLDLSETRLSRCVILASGLPMILDLLPTVAMPVEPEDLAGLQPGRYYSLALIEVDPPQPADTSPDAAIEDSAADAATLPDADAATPADPPADASAA